MLPTSSNQDAMEWSYYSRDYTMNDGNRVLLTTGPFLRGHEEDDYDDEESSLLMRHLTGETRGQAVLTFMYLCVLGLCFMTAVVYFCRMQWEERYLHRLREHEMGAIRSALAQSEATQREESRAVQRKYIEERRARILQLFVPVRMTLEPEHFAIDEEANKTVQEEANASSSERKDDEVDTNPIINTYGDEDSLLVEIPSPGLHLRLGANEKPPTRLVSGMCTICLCTFEVGSDVVWSSNEMCEHVFHAACVEKWLMRQREGPLCPCCRRDFIVDPYDLETNEGGGNFDPAMLAASNNPRVQAIFQHGAVDPEEDGEMQA